MVFRPDSGKVSAVLGPTNTGKTHLAVERMLGHATGVIGLPLRLLAREIYDRVVAQKGERAVALLTGEEKIVPAHPRWWVCTVEAMPTDRQFEFLAVDEIQLIADPDRGHVFTDRLMHARGRAETMFLGAETAKPLIRRLVPDAEFVARPRFSNLLYAGSTKLSRLPKRTAVVAFSAQDVYAIAELVRRQRGGAAVVLGALSPRTRNAQVAMFQEREVDFLVATDAIGMGLNMAVDHVAFAETRKFDGVAPRSLTPSEIGQIAGRAGRYMNDGTFGVTAELSGLDEDIVQRVENHRFSTINRARWRNVALDFGSVENLIRALGAPPPMDCLSRAREADDEYALRTLAHDQDLAPLMSGRDRVKLLWRVCQIPDFRKASPDSHVRLLAHIFGYLARPPGVLPTDWVARQVAQIDRTEGDIDTLSQRIANVRTWTYIAHQGDWLGRSEDWCARTRAIEDRLSDALHERLTQRFVDRRTSLLVRQLKDRRDFAVGLDADGGVRLDNTYVGRIAGLSFIPDDVTPGLEGRTLRSAASRAIGPLLGRRAAAFGKVGDDAISLGDDGRLYWSDAPVGLLRPGAHVLRPRIQLAIAEEIQGAGRETVQKRLDAWIAASIEKTLAPLERLAGADLGGAARGLAFRIHETMGLLPRGLAGEQVDSLDPADGRRMRAMGVRFGRRFIFMPALLKPAAARLKVILRAVADDRPPCPVPQPGRISLPVDPSLPPGHWAAAGFACAGPVAIRIDILERLAQALWQLSLKGPFAATPAHAQMIACKVDELPAVLAELGYRRKETDAGVVYARRDRKSGRKRPVPRDNGTSRKLDHSPFAGLRDLVGA